mmetsp:Transcript_46196/g.142446  ORF Transcript_46196/g.142446 Transcript_46196/m.142446 type:complete len:365 (-) Transcript_46196:1226-2320(-)
MRRRLPFERPREDAAKVRQALRCVRRHLVHKLHHLRHVLPVLHEQRARLVDDGNLDRRERDEHVGVLRHAAAEPERRAHEDVAVQHVRVHAHPRRAERRTDAEGVVDVPSELLPVVLLALLELGVDHLVDLAEVPREHLEPFAPGLVARAEHAVQDRQVLQGLVPHRHDEQQPCFGEAAVAKLQLFLVLIVVVTGVVLGAVAAALRQALLLAAGARRGGGGGSSALLFPVGSGARFLRGAAGGLSRLEHLVVGGHGGDGLRPVVQHVQRDGVHPTRLVAPRARVHRAVGVRAQQLQLRDGARGQRLVGALAALVRHPFVPDEREDERRPLRRRRRRLQVLAGPVSDALRDVQCHSAVGGAAELI